MNVTTKSFYPLKRNLSAAAAFMVCIALMLPMTASAEVITFDGAWSEAGFNLISQDASSVELIFSVPVMELSEIEIDGEMMHNVNIPGVILPNNAGAPDLPGTGRYIALPQGAQAVLEIIDFRTEVIPNMNIAPAFEIPIETDDSPLKYEKDLSIYNVNANYPAEPVMMSELTQMRGVDVVIVGITPFQYNPMTGDLTVYKDVHVRVSFIGGNGHFGEDRLRSRWWEPILKQNLMNYESLPEVNLHPERPATDEDNVEYIIIVPDDANFIAWADTLKKWRNAQGIITGVTTLSELGGNTYSNIDNYINNAYNTWSIPPVAVLLLSDYNSSGDLYGITANHYSYGFGYSCVSDNFYADVNNNQMPDVALARITAQDNTDLQTMINKMLTYERNPYTSTNFYNEPLMAGGWQTERWFILCTEVIQGFLANELGKSPEREYAIYSGYPGASWSSNQNTWMIVNYFGPSGLGYIPSTPSYLTDWSGNAAGVNAAINSGAFMVMHRDHGYTTGWGEPSYSVGNISGLNNTQYPYIFSINCSTGEFDSNQQSLAEAFHRDNNGALGVMAASAVSYSFVNDTFVWGVWDNMWPGFDPGYGSDLPGEENLRPGFANAAGKYYLQASSWPYNSSNKDETYYLFHHHGDAFMTMYSEVPQNLTVSHASSISAGSGSFTVTATDGSLIGLSANGDYLGAAEGTGSSVSIPISGLPSTGMMRVTVTKANYYRYMTDINITGGTTPNVTMDLTYVSGSPVPSTGGLLYYDVYVNNASGASQNFDAWLESSYQGGPGSLLVMRSFTNYLPGWTINRPNMYYPIPSAYAAGSYTFWGKVGTYPGDVWDSDSFPFTKLGTDSREDFVPFALDNMPNPFDKIIKGSDALVTDFGLLGAYPNPFNPTTTIKYAMDSRDMVKLSVYDVSGREVAMLVNGFREAGAHEVIFDASDLTSGVYVYQLTSNGRTISEKMILMK